MDDVYYGDNPKNWWFEERAKEKQDEKIAERSVAEAEAKADILDNF